jgi:anti-sigma regulatory factor (Ser/Thr protein kinase)
VKPSILTLAIHYERDLVLARQRTRQLAALLGFDAQDQTRLATAVSEIARNAFTYAPRLIEFRSRAAPPRRSSRCA